MLSIGVERTSDHKAPAATAAAPAPAAPTAPVAKTDAELISAAEKVLVDAKSCADFEEKSFYNPRPSQQGEQKEVIRESDDITHPPITVAVETGTNCKNDPKASPNNQDAAGVIVFDKPKNMSRAEMIKALDYATKKTGEELSHHTHAGTTFTASAVAQLTRDEKLIPFVTTAQVGDSGAMLVDEKTQNFISLTPTHNLSNLTEAERLRIGYSNTLSKITNKEIQPPYLYDGFSLHINPTLPVDHKLYAGSYILLKAKPFTHSTLYYVRRSKPELQRIRVNNFAQFEQMLNAIINDQNTALMAAITNTDRKVSLTGAGQTQTDWGYFVTKHPPAINPNQCSLRLSNFQFQAMIGNHCDIPPNLLPACNNQRLKAIGMSRSFGDNTTVFSGNTFAPAISQTVVEPHHILAVFTDGADSLKPIDKVKAIMKNELRKAAFLAGSIDDISAVIVRNLALTPDDKILVAIAADGHGLDSNKARDKQPSDTIAQEAIALFEKHFKYALELINAEREKNKSNVNVTAAAPAVQSPPRANRV